MPTYRSEDLAKDAKDVDPVLLVARDAVVKYSAGLETAGAPALANSMIQAVQAAQAALARVSEFPPSRRERANAILAEAAKRYSEWTTDIGTAELIYMAEQEMAIRKSLAPQEALVAREDAKLFINGERTLGEAFVKMVAAGGLVAKLAMSDYLEVVCSANGGDAKLVRATALGAYLRANPNDEAAKRLLAAPSAYGKVKAAMQHISSRLPGTMDSQFAKRAIAWNNDSAAKDREIEALRAQLKRKQG